MLRLAFDFIITWRETRTRPNAYIKEMLGHSDIKVTQIYAKVVDSKRNEVVECLNKVYHG